MKKTRPSGPFTGVADHPDSLLHIFTGEGNTFTFHNVVLLTDNESILSFQYGAMSDGRVKVGEFSKKRVVGFSMTK